MEAIKIAEPITLIQLKIIRTKELNDFLNMLNFLNSAMCT